MNTAHGPTALDLSAAQRFGLMRQAQDALKRDPKNVDALLTMAGIYGAEGNFGAALDALKKALSLRKKNPEILRRLVSAANDANDLALARKYARKLVEIEPRVAANHKKYGLIQELLGFPAAAIEAYLKADRLEPRQAQTLHDIGRCYGLTGDHAKALEYYEKALAAEPAYGLALYSYSAAKKFSEAELADFLAKVETAIPSAKEMSIRANLHYAAGKALDDVGRYDEAFDWFAKANALRRPEGVPAILPPFSNATQGFSKELLLSKAGYGLSTDQPIFVVGMPRSGTTLTESLVGAHSKVTAGDEKTFMNDIAKSLGRNSEVEGAFRRNLEALKQADIRRYAEEYLSLCKPTAGNTPHFTDKLPHNFMNVGLIAMLFPNAKIVHCRRHPLDNCLSLFSNSMRMTHNRYKTDLTQLGLYYRQYLKLMEHWRSVLPGKMHEVFYEDLVVNTELNARATIDYLGLEWEDGVMARSRSQRSVRTLSGWQVRQPVYQSSKGKWRHYEKHLGALIEAIGLPTIEAYETALEGLASDRGTAS